MNTVKIQDLFSHEELSYDIYAWENFRTLESVMTDKLVNIRGDLDNYVDLLENAIENCKTPEQFKEAFLLYYALFNFHRKFDNLDDLRSMIEGYHDLFDVEKNPTALLHGEIKHNPVNLTHIYLLFRLVELQLSSQQESHEIYEDAGAQDEKWLDLLKKSRVFLELVTQKGNTLELSKQGFKSGVYHLYVDIYVTLAEITEDRNDSKFRKDLLSKKQFEYTKRILEEAIATNNHGKFYQTKARLHIVNGEFTEALNAIHDAIRIEDPNKETYQQSMMNYLFTKQSIIFKKNQMEMMKAQQEMMVKMEETTESLEGAQIQVIEIVGFFTGIISFVISSVQILGAMEIQDAAKLIVLLIGGWIISYAAFSFTFQKYTKTNIVKSGVMALMGFLIMLGGKYFVL